jgi:hypothetical protein
MDLQLVADEQNEDRAKRRKDNAGGMEAFVAQMRKQVGDCSAKKRPDDSERDCPKIVMCTCMMDLAITPAIKPTMMYQMK